jgi:hypothetical protein
LLGAALQAEAAWSPDSRHILVALGTSVGPPESHVVGLLDRAGEFIRRYEAFTTSVWIDAERFALFAPEFAQDEDGVWSVVTDDEGQLVGEWSISSVDSSALEPTDLPNAPLLSSGHGALAVGGFAGGEAMTSVWSDGGLSEPLAGRPAGWSPDGSTLAIVHPEQSGPSGEGPFEVFSWPGLALLYSGAASVSDVAFSPNGARLVYPTFTELPHQPREVPEFELTLHVVDIATGSETAVATGENGAFEWLDEARLLVVGYESNHATVYSLDGSSEDAGLVAGPDVIAAATTLVFYDDELDEPPLSVLRTEGVREIESPGALTGPAPVLAPDGSGIIAVVRAVTGAAEPAAQVMLHNL